jgi:hypothetical protein
MIDEHTQCSKCNHINPPYKNTCEVCKSYLRERVVNIDLWKTIFQLIEEPKLSFRNIVYAEHKNFILFLLFFISIKNLILTRFISVPQLGLNGAYTSFIVSLFLSILSTMIIVSAITSIQSLIYKKQNILLRFVDVFALNTYNLFPFLVGIFILFPIELVVLGGDIFSNNPYPFEIKPTITYLLIGFEVITIIFSLILFFKSVLIARIKTVIAIILTLLFLIIWFATLFVSSKIIFTI